jgi:hypothetical protein
MKIRLASSPMNRRQPVPPSRRPDPRRPVFTPKRPDMRPEIITPNLPPVHFFGEATVPPGEQATLRSSALSNRTGRPIDIYEIRLAAAMNFVDSSAGSFINIAGISRVKLSANGKKITNGFVPIWNFGKTENRAVHAQSGRSRVSTMYVLRLSKPWHVPNGTTIEAEVFNSGGLNYSSVIKVGLAGRYVAQKEPTSCFPYVAAYVSRPFDYSTAILTDESSELDLVNATGKDLNVDRIIGRASIIRSGGPLSGFFNDTDDAAVDSIMSIRMVTSNNRPIIPEYTPIRQIFGIYPSAIEIPHTMAPNDFYRVSVKKVAGVVLDSPFTGYTAQANISIVGWRNEAV